MNVTLSELETFVAVLFVLFGGVITIGKVVDTIKSWKKPGRDVLKRLSDAEAHLDTDNRRLKQLEESDKVIMKSQLAMIEHMKTSNGFNKLEEAANLINNHLLSR